MKKPISTHAKIINGLIIFRLVLMALTVIIFAIAADATNPVLAGMRDGITRSFHLEGEDHSYALGNLIGILAIPIILLFFIRDQFLKSRFGWAIGLSLVDLLLGFVAGLPILQFILLILIIAYPRKKKTEPVETSISNTQNQ